MQHCLQINDDRKLGEYWERQFCVMAAKHGFMFTPMQIGRNKSATAFYGVSGWIRLILPDVTVWTAPGQHHEIKHKSPTRYNQFGLEEYRLNSLLEFSKVTKQDVMYTIHNHALSGGRDISNNDIEHWLTCNVLNLTAHDYQSMGNSYINGVKKECLIFYWDISRFITLSKYWRVNL